MRNTLKLLIFILMCFITVQSASAFSNTSRITYAFTFDNAYATHAPSVGLNNTFNMSYTTGIGVLPSGWAGAGVYFSQLTANMTMPSANHSNYTISLHFYMNSSTSDGENLFRWGQKADTVGARRVYYYIATGLGWQDRQADGGYNANADTAVGALNRWHHYLIFSNGTHNGRCLDGVCSYTAVTREDNDFSVTANGNFGKGDANAMLGLKLDDIAILLGYTPTLAEIIELNNTPLSTYFSPPAGSFIVSANDAKTSGQITRFNITIQDHAVYNTSNGSIVTTILNNETRLYNISASGECGAVFCNYTTQTLYNFNVSSGLTFNLSKWFYGGASYQGTIFELTEQTMTYRINHSVANFTHTISDVTGALLYNGVYKSVSAYVYENYSILNATFITPLSTTGNVSFIWFYNISRTNGVNSDTYRANATNNQYINGIGLDNCSTYTSTAHTFYLLNESNGASLNGFLAGYFTAWIDDISQYRAFNLTWTNGTSFSVCINNQTGVYQVSGQIQYGASGFNTETHYFVNATFDNVTNTQNLYLTASSSTVQFTVKDEYDTPVSDAYIYIQYYDLTTNTAQTTEVIKTSSDGTALAQLVLYYEFYKFIIVYNGDVVLETNPVLLTSTSYEFSVVLGSDFFNNYDVARNVACDISHSTITNTFTLTYADTTGTTTQGCLYIDRWSNGRVVRVNTSCVSGSSNTFGLTPRNYTGSDSFTATSTIFVNDQEYACGTPESYDQNVNYIEFGLEGVALSLLIIMTVVGIGLFSPVVAVAVSIVALVLVSMIQMFYMSYVLLISIVILGIITIYKVNR